MRWLGFVAVLAMATPAMAQSGTMTRQADVEQRGMAVMPFDQTRSMHMFEPAPDGGTMMIMSSDGDAQQIALIRSHLRHEATAFAAGDFSDPMAIHGANMPGLAILKAKAPLLHITYQDMPMGAEIVFATDDTVARQALGDWFGAQVMDHGAHAMIMK